MARSEFKDFFFPQIGMEVNLMTKKLKLHTYFQLILKINKRDDFFLNLLRLQDMIIAITLLHEFTTNKI